MDSASSHTARKTYKWLDDHGIKHITKEESLPNSPEVSPVDFFANGYFKKRLAKGNKNDARHVGRRRRGVVENSPGKVP